MRPWTILAGVAVAATPTVCNGWRQAARRLPDHIGVNDFLKLGEAGTEKVADLRAAAKV
jgi:hypothetical protein